MATKLSIEEVLMLSKVVICDIEGTTSSISFVKDILFPYALKNVESFLNTNWETDSLKTIFGELRVQSIADLEAKLDGAVEILPEDSDKEALIKSIVQSVKWLMGNDRKVNCLKNLQGLIWENAYKDGSIKGHVYEDVAKAFECWITAGKKIYIYSSGSVLAQKLLFQYSEAGNLLEKIAGHFDTKIGLKHEADSYKKIVEEIGEPAENCLFLTDIIKEGNAAKLSGLNVIIINRPGNAAFSDEDKKNVIIAETFEELMVVDSLISGKRKIETDGADVEEKPTKMSKLESDETKKPDEAIENPTPVVTEAEKIYVEKEKSTDVDMKDTPEEQKDCDAITENSVVATDKEQSTKVDEIITPTKEDLVEFVEETKKNEAKVEETAMDVDEEPIPVVKNMANILTLAPKTKPAEKQDEKTEETFEPCDNKLEKTEEIVENADKNVIEKNANEDVEMKDQNINETDNAVATIDAEEKKGEISAAIEVVTENNIDVVVKENMENNIEKTNGTNGKIEETKESEKQKTEEKVLEKQIEIESSSKTGEKIIDIPDVVAEKQNDEQSAEEIIIAASDKLENKSVEENETGKKNSDMEEKKNGDVEKVTDEGIQTVAETETEKHDATLGEKNAVDNVANINPIDEGKGVKNGNGVEKNGHSEKTEEKIIISDEAVVIENPAPAAEVDDIEKIKKIKESLVATKPAVVVDTET